MNRCLVWIAALAIGACMDSGSADPPKARATATLSKPALVAIKANAAAASSDSVVLKVSPANTAGLDPSQIAGEVSLVLGSGEQEAVQRVPLGHFNLFGAEPNQSQDLAFTVPEAAAREKLPAALKEQKAWLEVKLLTSEQTEAAKAAEINIESASIGSQ